MSMSHTAVRNTLVRVLKSNRVVESLARGVSNQYESVHHSVANVFPAVIRPRNIRLTMALTAHCNARCVGCRYGRDFMPGAILPLSLVNDVLEDAKEAGFRVIRLYGGEPLLYRDLPRVVSQCIELGLKPYLTTNAVLLDRKIDGLFDAGLRDITVGFYGVDAAYDQYVQTPGLYKRVENSIATVRQRYGDKVTLQMNWLLMRPSCNPESLRKACEFAERYDMKIQVDLIHYSLPYFTEGPNAMLQFRPEDRSKIAILVGELLALKKAKPDLFTATPEALRSIPDWLIKGPKMQVPCTAYEMVWIGADGTVQLCYVSFKLGNLHQQRLRDMLCGDEYARAARGAFMLHCPNCHCAYSDRIMRDRQSRLRYATPHESNTP